MSAPLKLAGLRRACSSWCSASPSLAGERDRPRSRRRATRGRAPATGGTATSTAGMAAHEADPIRGLAVAEDGLRLSLAATSLPRGDGHRRCASRSTDGDGPVRDFEVTHEKRMHLIVVRRDGTRLPAPAPDARRRRHLERADHAARRRRVPRLRGLPARRRGAHARRRPDGRRRRRLRAVPRAATTATETDGYTRRARRATATTLAFAITRGRQAGRDRAVPRRRRPPGRAARGRSRLPARAPDRGDGVAFEADLDPDSRYRLYLQFKHDGRVHTAEFTR